MYVCGRLVLAVVNWSVTPTDAVCSVILDVRVSLLEMKTKWRVERKIWWPDENEIMQQQGSYEGQIMKNSMPQEGGFCLYCVVVKRCQNSWQHCF
jgi:hypothetical protein